ncbi:MAG: alpha/beta hydrolase [Planctomycetota bacterium]|nr:alpha/beta hydrolase [Planctomycetota bacterium]
MASKSQFFQSFNLNIHYEIFSQELTKTPIICIHGFLDHGGTFGPLVPTLAKEHPVVLLDRRGYGDSDHIPHGRYHFTAHLLDIANLIKELEAECVILMGHSMGGLIALLYAGTYPDQIEKLIVLESFGIKDETKESPERIRSWIAAQQRDPEEPKVYESIEVALKRLKAVHKNVPADILKAWGLRGLKELDDGQVRFKADPKHKGREPIVFREDIVRVHAQKIACPTLVARGTESVVKEFPSWVDEIPNVKKAEMPGGHMCHLEHPDLLINILKDFLALG